MGTRKKPVETWSGQIVMSEVSTERLKDTTESTVLGRIKAALSVIPGCHVMRNNSGCVKAGRRWIRFGLGVGSADLICVVAPLGRLVAIETKRPKGGRTSEEQEKWLASMRSLGAIAGVVTSVNEAIELVRQAREAR